MQASSSASKLAQQAEAAAVLLRSLRIMVALLGPRALVLDSVRRPFLGVLTTWMDKLDLPEASLLETVSIYHFPDNVIP